MTNEQKQQIKARFFGEYIGCEVDIKAGSSIARYGINHGSILNGEQVLVSVGELAKYSDANFDIKLILRPLASITDDEAIECAKIYDADLTWKIYKRNEYFVQVENSDLELFTIWFPRDDTSLITLIDVADNTCAFNQFECIVFFRSKSFAIPFQGLDPIAENWAILEPETPQP